MAEGDGARPTSAEREAVRAEAARQSAVRSVRCSACAWGVLAVSWALTSLGAVGVGIEPWAPLVVALAALVVATPVAFVVLTVLAVRAAWRGLDSGYPVTRWANVLAWLDVLASVVLVVSLVLAVWFVVWLHQCTPSTCQLSTF